ncbi:MAG: hypothetical protein D3909_17075, partial [Candidatus Electrothrix sp. ATG1]|nr:hypothetical protein [Candidatus Electrothrix sp. ATG1]
MSYGGVPGVFLWTSDYPYADYIPQKVTDFMSHPESARAIELNLATQVFYPQTGQLYGPGGVALDNSALSIDVIGDPLFRSSENYLDFSPVWAGFGSLEDGYRKLEHNPTVYYKIFRSIAERLPIAIQYWFGFFYNDWQFDHPGDWETVTIFLTENEEPVEMIFSTHYEANKYSWGRVQLSHSESTHPHVFISNGGHGCYQFSGTTPYSSINDDHLGDQETLVYGNGNSGDLLYALEDLGEIDSKSDGWTWFEGPWGNNGRGIDEGPAPKGPHFRTDTNSSFNWGNANHPPYDPDSNCVKRDWGTKIYGDISYIVDPPWFRGPWDWASGYGLDHPWESQEDCLASLEPHDFSWNLFLPAILAANSSASTAPKLIAPANGSTLDTLVPLYEFDVSDDPEATGFILEVSKNP